MKIYDTDEEHILNKVYNDYFMDNDIVDMQDIIWGGKIPEKRRRDEFLKCIYEDISYDEVYHCKVDPIYD